MLVKTKTACLVLLCLCVMHVRAQLPSYPFSRIDISQGLSHNRITCIYKDHKGFMWFGTIAGLNRYDGYGFKVFINDAGDTSSLPDNYITRIFELPGNQLFIQSRDISSIYNPQTEKFTSAAVYLQQKGLPVMPLTNIVKTGESFWFLYANGGLFKLTEDKKVVKVAIGNQAAPGEKNFISFVKADSKNNILAVCSNGVIAKIDSKTNNTVFRTGVVQKQLAGQEYNFSLYADTQDDIWLYMPTMPVGAFYYNTFTNQSKRLTKENGGINNNIVNGIVQDGKGKVWIGTDHGGINLLDKATFTVEYLKNKEDDNTTLSQNVITTLYKDNAGIIWLGTFKKGVDYYHENNTRIPLYHHLLTDKNSLSYDDVNRFAEDAKGNIWIGTNGGGLLYFNRASNTFTQYKHDAGNNNTISNDVIVSLCIDHEQKLWIGSYFGGIDCYDGKKFTHYRHDDNNAASLTEDRVWEIYEDKSNNLWVGTFNGGLDKFDRVTNSFQHYRKGGSNSVSSNYISSFTEDSQGNLWVGTDGGIDVRNKQTGRFKHFSTPHSGVVKDDIISLLHDADNNIWIGTRNGLCVYNEQKKSFQCFNTQDGLPDNTILNILQDNDKQIWISTPDGVGKIALSNSNGIFKISCKNYDEMDGLQSLDFNENAAFKTREGEIIFGGANGFNIFNPSSLKENNYIPAVVFTDFQLFNKSIAVGQQVKKHIVLNESIAEAKNVTLNYNDNVFSIEFAALSFHNTEKNKYMYKLDGFDDQWLMASTKTRRATYTNLNPGTYTFHVKASNDNGIWNDAGATLTITVLPPFWRTNVAYFFYILLFIGLLMFARKAIIKRTHARIAIAQERKEAQRLHALDMLKIKFFTNVSHEFRTPLSLILTPLEKIIRNTQEQEHKKQLQLIQRNGKRMLNLVNQLLDFRKMEVQELKLNVQQGNVARFIKDICYSFTDIAETKQINFSYTSNKENYITLFDTDKLERILFNLLSNAFKFTMEKGNVNVDVSITTKNGIAETKIKVSDTGIGIPKEKYEQIFDRFFQHDMPETILNQGSGIGLAITREFVKIYDGTITVESEVNKGSCFTVILPLKEIQQTIDGIDVGLAFAETAVEDDALPAPVKLEAPAAKSKTSQKKKQTILLIDDNEDFLFYLKDNLKEFYNIEEARDGKQGWQKVLSAHPDLIVSDVNMPVMDGIKFCKKVKADARTRHIPVILLTALAGEDAHVAGLETGAADYMTKPFNFEIMLSKIRNILEGQKILKKAYEKQVEVKATEIEIENQDEKFMQKVLEIVEKNLSNPNFSVEALSRELYMSRVSAYKKIFVLTGKAPIDFIRSIRLQRAAQLLDKSDMSVAEIAYEVGFNNPKYFSKFFKAEYNVVPSEYGAKK